MEWKRFFWLKALSAMFVGLLNVVGLPTAVAQDAATPNTATLPAKNNSGWVKGSDIVIYQSDQFHCAFPSIVLRPSGELILAFRRAPERRIFGEPSTNHTDPNSYLVLVRSSDNGATWTKEPELLFAHPFGGSQDPCMIALRDGSIVCGSYGWTQLRGEEVLSKFDQSQRHGEFIFMGGYVLRSEDDGHSWKGPFIPLHVPGDVTLNVFGKPTPAFNRGAMCEGKDGTLYWAVASKSRKETSVTETHLLRSTDGGRSWNYVCPIAQDEKVTFNETSLYETPKGDLIAFMRTAAFEDHTAIARSSDGGKSFQHWQDAGFQGHPHFALRLPDNRVLLIYGYRHEPFGIRARILDPECTNFATAEEIVLRNDGGNGDLGYPWATMTADGRVLVVYYFNQKNGPRHIAGTWLIPQSK